MTNTTGSSRRHGYWITEGRSPDDIERLAIEHPAVPLMSRPDERSDAWFERMRPQLAALTGQVLSLAEFVTRRQPTDLPVIAELDRLQAHAPGETIDLPPPTALSSDQVALDVSFGEDDGDILVELQVRNGAEGLDRVRDQEFLLVFGETTAATLTTAATFRFDDDGHAAYRLPDRPEVRGFLAGGPYTLVAVI